MQETLKELRDSLRPLYGERETEAIIRIIFHYLKGWTLTDMLIHADEHLSAYIREEINKILTRLLKHEPIQYITGEARFHGMNFIVKPGVLIPRAETDELTDIIIDDYKDKPDLRILDICSGSGCIAITLARNLKFSDTDALDNSETAIATAKENAKNLKCKINFINADIFHWEPDEDYDIIVSNPPYVDESEAEQMDKNVLDFEPREAIFVSDENPLVFYNRIAGIALKSLKKEGSLYLEINPRHVSALKELLLRKGFSKVNIMRDSSGKERFMVCKKS